MSGDDTLSMADGDPARLVIDGAGAMNECIERLFLGCRRSLRVRARRLDYDFYFSDSFDAQCRSIIPRGLRNELLFLVEDEHYVIKANARLVTLARQYSSYVKIRVIPAEHIEHNEMFIVQDGGAYLHQPHVDTPRGIFSSADRGGVARLERRFRDAWEHGFQPRELFVTGL